MQFVAPIKFEEAIKKLGDRSPIGAQLSSEQWSAVPVELRERAFFSATIESVRFLQDNKNGLQDFLEANRDPDTGALKVGSKAKFIDVMRRKAIADGLGPLDPEDAGTIKDIRSEKRLGLIFDVNRKSAQAFGDRKQGLDPDVLNEFPGQRLIRVRDVQDPRPNHSVFEGHVALKTDLNYWLRINVDFGVPWAPWGWGCGHDVEDVDRDATDQLGLTTPGQRVQGGDDEKFNAHLKASVTNLEPETIQFLRSKFGNQIEIKDGAAEWKPGQATPDPAPSPAPSPLPTTEGQGPDFSPSGQDISRAWLQDLDSLAEQYQTAPVRQKEALRESAREAISVPQAARAGVPLDHRLASRIVQNIANAGNDQIARFVDPRLTTTARISTHHNSDDRAFYRSGGIYLNAYSDLSTAAHEIMHGIELQNPGLLQKTAQFLLGRRRAISGVLEQPQPLRKLTGLNYRWSEIAIEDEWIKRGGAVYAGKVYSSGSNLHTVTDINATEILTTGIERLIADPIDFYTRDPDWFHFMVETIGIGKSL